MLRSYKPLFLAFIFSVILTGCQQKSANLPEVKDISKNAKETQNIAPAAVLGSKINNESGLLEVIAKKINLPDLDKYQLHDVDIKGDYARGRFSYDNDLRPDTFWAMMSAGIWRLVYLSDQTPDCSSLSGFPRELISGCREDINKQQISNFTDCVAAGFQPTSDQPRRCLDNKGDVFVEVDATKIKKRYISQNVVNCHDLDFDCESNEKPFLDDIGCGCQK